LFTNILRYRNGLYLWWSLALLVVCIAIYASHSGEEPPNGGTWQGYVLGTIGALLIVWLTLLGIRKRSYNSSMGSVQGWTSAHVYLGAATLVVASLHSAMQFGWNVHTLAYIVMCLVIFSGFYGLHVYINYPRSMSANRMGGSRDMLFAELYELNNTGLKMTRRCGPTIREAIESSIERTAIGGGVRAQLMGSDNSLILLSGAERATFQGPHSDKPVSNLDQQLAIDIVAEWVPKADKADEAVALEELLSVLCRRQTIIRRLRKDIQLQGWVQVWLYVHIPLTIALFFALAVHIVTTFLYW